jgi:hypothetical protein
MLGPVKSVGSRKRGITNSKPDNPEQFKRFIDMAREVEVDVSPDAVDKAFDRVMGRQVSREHADQNRSPRKTKSERPPK